MDNLQERKNVMEVGGRAGAMAGVPMGRKLSTHYLLEARNPAGELLWQDEFDNLVVTAGLNDSLDKHLKGSTYTAAWYVGLVGATPTFAAADVNASHAGWTEVTAYDEATRPAVTFGSVSGGSVSNTASKARFTISTNGTAIGGAFMASTNNKTGTVDILYGGGAMTEGNRTLADNDTLDVTITCTAAAA